QLRPTIPGLEVPDVMVNFRELLRQVDAPAEVAFRAVMRPGRQRLVLEFDAIQIAFARSVASDRGSCCHRGKLCSTPCLTSPVNHLRRFGSYWLTRQSPNENLAAFAFSQISLFLRMLLSGAIC